METKSSNFDADGCVYHLNLSDELMRKVAKKCPILSRDSSGNNRNVRHIVQNKTKYLTSSELLDQLKGEIETQLSEMGGGTATVSTTLSNAEWVLASPLSRARGRGKIHRDTKFTRKPGILTVLIFLDKRKEIGYGGVKVYKNSAGCYPDSDVIPEDKGVYKHYLKKLGPGSKINTKDFNCVVFDSRLFHYSQPHSRPATYHRVSLTFFLRLSTVKKRIPKSDTSGFVSLSGCHIVDLSEDI